MMVIAEVIVAWVVLKEHFAADEHFPSHFKAKKPSTHTHTHTKKEKLHHLDVFFRKH